MYMYFITTETVNCYVRTMNAIMLVPDVLIYITEKARNDYTHQNTKLKTPLSF